MSEGTKASSRGLGASARASLLWGGGFTIANNIAQFATMLILVRVLTPADYGSAALAQSILGLVGVFSFNTFAAHAVQLRDPSEVDWQAHFTAAAVINTSLFCATAAIAWSFWISDRYSDSALPLIGMSFVLLLEIPGTMRYRMLEVHHDWKRFRLLVLFGALLGLGSGVFVALLGGGVWALVIQGPLSGVPTAIDLFVTAQWRPRWSWSWLRYRETARFAGNRIAAAFLWRGRQAVESAMLASSYDLAALGVFTRSLGLATIVAGRIGSVATGSLYPVITRAEARSAQFRRYSGLVTRGVTWTTLPAAAIVALTAGDTVRLLYGPQWSDVSPLLPLAAASVGFGGITTAVTSLLLGNNEISACLAVEAVSAVVGVGLAIWLVPVGITVYLAALALLGVIVLCLALGLLVRARGIDGAAIRDAFFPAAVAGAAASAVIACSHKSLGTCNLLVLNLVFDLGIFCTVYLAVLRFGFVRQLQELVEVIPGGMRLRILLALAPRSV